MAHPAFTATLPSEAEAGVAKETIRLLAAHLKKDAPMQLRILGDDTTQATVNLPAPAVGLLLRILEEMARGNAVTIIPVHAELTTQEAADMLNISRPSLIQLLDEGKIQYRRVGTHRRVRFEALMKYKRHTDEERRAALDELAAYDQELGI
jgi:excisionase family DNA binding protein